MISWAASWARWHWPITDWYVTNVRDLRLKACLLQPALLPLPGDRRVRDKWVNSLVSNNYRLLSQRKVRCSNPRFPRKPAAAQSSPLRAQRLQLSWGGTLLLVCIDLCFSSNSYQENKLPHSWGVGVFHIAPLNMLSETPPTTMIVPD